MTDTSALGLIFTTAAFTPDSVSTEFVKSMTAKAADDLLNRISEIHEHTATLEPGDERQAAESLASILMGTYDALSHTVEKSFITG